MSDDWIDAQLSELARDYNRPPPVPRDEMWAAIADARAPRPARWRRRSWIPAGAGMAATFLLGMLIGGGLPGETERSAVAVSENATATPLIDEETARHFARVDLVLRSIRSDLEVGAVPAGASDAARSLLADTRFLLDLPPEDHLPSVVDLLADVELVLAQIAALDGVTDPKELRLAEEGIDSREVLPRLHHFALNL